MDGILEELLRLEGVKNRALIDLDPAAYEDSVQKQIELINDPGISEAARTGKETLVAISKLSNFNTTLYENLLATAPWILAASRSYTGQGQIEDPAATHAFSAEV
jgi:hypothetical protein